MRALPFLVLPLLASSAFADEAALDAWLTRQTSLKSLDVGFTQERQLPALKEPTRTRGRVTFQKPDKVRWQLGEPMETLAVSDGATFTLLDAAKRTATRIPADSPQAARFSLIGGKAFESPAAFREAFEIVEHRVTSGIHQYTVRAKDRRLRSQMPWIFLDIDPAKKELRALEFELKDKSRVRTVFENPRFDAKLPDSFFQPDLDGYQIK